MRNKGAYACAMGTVMAALPALWLSAMPAAAQTPGNFAHDTTQPINVSADRLEVREDGRTAVFSGHVEAVQGDLKLTATEIRVYYRPGGTSSEMISRIDATGDVAIETPDESAKGDWAIYDVDQKILTLGGAIEITRGDNKVSGQRLVLDLDSGRTQIESGSNGQSGRVRGVFSPSDAGVGGPSRSGGDDKAPAEKK